MARLALQYVSNFPSSTNQHSIVRRLRSLFPTSAIHIPSVHRGAINKVLVRFLLFVHFVRLRLYAADLLPKRKEACTIPLSPSNRDWPRDFREKENETEETISFRPEGRSNDL